MSAISEIEKCHQEWIGTASHAGFVKWYTTIGMQMNVTNVCHDHLCAGIWRAVEKWKHEEQMKLIENSNNKKLAEL